MSKSPTCPDNLKILVERMYHCEQNQHYSDEYESTLREFMCEFDAQPVGMILAVLSVYLAQKDATDRMRR